MNTQLVQVFGKTLAQTQWLSRKKLAEYQYPLLERLLRHARDSTPFYESRLPFDLGSPAAIDKAWHSIPVLTRTEASAHRENLKSRRLPHDTGDIFHEETSGSTGIPFEFLKSGLTVAATQALTERMFHWWKLDGRKSFATLSYNRRNLPPIPREGTTSVGWYTAEPSGTKLTFDAGADTDTQLTWLQSTRPDYLATFSTNLSRLAERAIGRGLDLRFSAVLSFGTRVDPAIRELCLHAFGAKIADSYGSQEVGHVATECPECGEYHVAMEAARIEVVRDDNRPAGPGESGRIVATPLYNYAMPLIRYDMGDFAVVGKTRPSCGRGLPALRRILGRARNRFRFRDGTVSWPELADFRLSDLVDYEDIQLVQTALDRIEVRYVPKWPEQPPTNETAVLERVQTALRQPLTVTIRKVETLGRITHGKIDDCVCVIDDERLRGPSDS
jgi:phenylacetate-CoA ligase